MKRKKLLIQILLFSFACAIPTGVSATKDKKKKPAVQAAEPADSLGANKQSAYRRLLNGTKSSQGLFTVYRTRSGNYYFEIADSLLNRQMLIGSRVCEISNNARISAGQRRSNPVLISLSRQDKLLCLHEHATDQECAPTDGLYTAWARNNRTPVTLTFDIAARNDANDASVIDVTKFFSSEVDLVWPAGVTNGAGRPDPKLTRILDMRSFPQQVEIKTHYNYVGGKEPLCLTVQYSFLLLPTTPMPLRINDERIGYNGSARRKYVSGQPVESYKLVNRWDIRPRRQDIEKYKNGELVVPEKPILFYVDTVMPAEWRRYVREGIESWNLAFEKIGFKNVIKAIDYPKDRSFDSNDSRYNCFKYLPSTDANAMGAQWIDPRSGEIVQGEILWWHNVIEKLRSWLFVQTAAADPDVRSPHHIPAETIGNAIRYAAAHEMGHVLGLQHNMRGSFAYPTDSLRSPSFTQRYGTTASIMDYARNNYVAQPGDKEKGVYLYPPVLGPYDYFAIQYGYRFIPETASEAAAPEAELPILNSWLTAPGNHPFYLYAPATVSPILPDPSAQADALGDDLLLSARYGISNLRYITTHLEKWTLETGDEFSLLQQRYDDLFKLYSKLTTLPLSYLGGVYTYPGTYGQHEARYVAVDRKKQKETLDFIFAQLTTSHQWLVQPSLVRLLGSPTDDIMKWQTSIIESLFGNFILNRILANQSLYTPEDKQASTTGKTYTQETYTKEAYTPEAYLKDMDQAIWKHSGQKVLTSYDRHVQLTYIDKLTALSKTLQQADPKGNGRSQQDTVWGSAAYGQLQLLLNRLQSMASSSAPADRSHYALLLKLVKNAL